MALQWPGNGYTMAILGNMSYFLRILSSVKVIGLRTHRNARKERRQASGV
jgi:hypothetical protein